MNKHVYSGLALLMLMMVSPAFATETEHTTLTTKNYVDQGLRAVYQPAKYAYDKVGQEATQTTPATGLIGRVDALEDTVGDATDGLVKDVNDLKDTVGDATEGLVKKVNDLEINAGKTYGAGDGVSVTVDPNNSNNNLINIDAPSDGNKYVFKDGQWVPLPTVDTWDPGILTQ